MLSFHSFEDGDYHDALCFLFSGFSFNVFLVQVDVQMMFLCTASIFFGGFLMDSRGFFIWGFCFSSDFDCGSSVLRRKCCVIFKVGFCYSFFTSFAVLDAGILGFLRFLNQKDLPLKVLIDPFVFVSYPFPFLQCSLINDLCLVKSFVLILIQ